MTLKIILLGILQGATEFLPVSSSGHLVLVQNAFHITQDTLFLDVLLHAGTLLAILVFFFKDILAALRSRRTIGLIALCTVATALVAFPFKDMLESLFSSPRAVSVLLVINGLILISTRWFPRGEKTPGAKTSLVMGLAQGLAAAPGISRSGATITALLAFGTERGAAVRFSFIASLPVIAGALLLEARDLRGAVPFTAGDLALGLAASFLAGLLALSCLMRAVRAERFHWFGFYTIALGLTAFILNAPRA